MKLEFYIKPGTVLDIQPYAGAEIEETKKQAINIATLLNGNVRFLHNGTTYMCDRTSCIVVSTPDKY
jgi:hypothetical protein